MIEIGSVVYSKAGRDNGNCYMVIAVEGNNYYMVVDGEARTLLKPKRKNIRHLRTKGASLPQIAEKILAKKQVFDSEVRSALRAHKEV